MVAKVPESSFNSRRKSSNAARNSPTASGKPSAASRIEPAAEVRSGPPSPNTIPNDDIASSNEATPDSNCTIKPSSARKSCTTVLTSRPTRSTFNPIFSMVSSSPRMARSKRASVPSSACTCSATPRYASRVALASAKVIWKASAASVISGTILVRISSTAALMSGANDVIASVMRWILDACPAKRSPASSKSPTPMEVMFSEATPVKLVCTST